MKTLLINSVRSRTADTRNRIRPHVFPSNAYSGVRGKSKTDRTDRFNGLIVRRAQVTEYQLRRCFTGLVDVRVRHRNALLLLLNTITRVVVRIGIPGRAACPIRRSPR